MMSIPSIRSLTIGDRIGAMIVCVLLVSFYIALSVERESLAFAASVSVLRIAPLFFIVSPILGLFRIWRDVLVRWNADPLVLMKQGKRSVSLVSAVALCALSSGYGLLAASAFLNCAPSMFSAALVHRLAFAGVALLFCSIGGLAFLSWRDRYRGASRSYDGGDR
jgi:hypothetical protein